MSTNWRVRRIRVGEGLRLRAFRLHALADAPAAFGSTLAREQAYAEEVWRQRAAEGAAALERVTVVAERDEQWVGMASGFADAPNEPAQMGPVLVGMFVAGRVRRLGIGEALVDGVRRWAASRGESRLHLWVVSTNAPALGLYRRCGFQAAGATRPVSHTPGLTELLMVTQLWPR
jgi:GNAT superfamily N-acetyltransferase